jgi:hypothetical protein
MTSAAVQVLHVHPAGPVNEIKNCPVCQLATATALAILVVSLFFVRRTTTYFAASEILVARSVFASFTLFSRPPPTA